MAPLWKFFVTATAVGHSFFLVPRFTIRGLGYGPDGGSISGRRARQAPLRPLRARGVWGGGGGLSRPVIRGARGPVICGLWSDQSSRAPRAGSAARRVLSARPAPGPGRRVGHLPAVRSGPAGPCDPARTVRRLLGHSGRARIARPAAQRAVRIRRRKRVAGLRVTGSGTCRLAALAAVRGSSPCAISRGGAKECLMPSSSCRCRGGARRANRDGGGGWGGGRVLRWRGERQRRWRGLRVDRGERRDNERGRR